MLTCLLVLSNFKCTDLNLKYLLKIQADVWRSKLTQLKQMYLWAQNQRKDGWWVVFYMDFSEFRFNKVDQRKCVCVWEREISDHISFLAASMYLVGSVSFPDMHLAQFILILPFYQCSQWSVKYPLLKLFRLQVYSTGYSAVELRQEAVK